MKRRHFLGTLATASVSGALLHGQQSAETSSPAAAPLVRTPLCLMAPTADGIDGVWAVTALAKGKLEWEGEDGSKGEAATDAFGFVPQGDKILRVRLRGLKAGTGYKIRSITTAGDGDRQEASPWKSFRTLNPAAASTSFVVWNDTHVNNPSIQQLHEATPRADFLLWNGDTCNDWTAEDLLIPTLLHPGERDITEGRPLFMTWGNHDVRGKFAYQLPSMVATPNHRPFYAFRSGPVAAICLHTGEDKPDNHPSFQGRVSFDALRREQTAWLKDAIQQPGFRDAPYRVIFCHIPLRWRDESPQDYDKTGFDRHSGRSRAAWHDALVEWKAQIIISGHTHQPLWMPPTDEFPYGQLIGGGPQPRSATWMEAKADASQLQIKVQGLDGQLRHEVALKPLS